MKKTQRRPAAVSMKEDEYQEARDRAERLGLNFSAYVNALIRLDLRSDEPLHILESRVKDPTNGYEAKKPNINPKP